jgi:hypothetical protein
VNGAEVITACENICRDYHALPAFLSGIEPLVPLIAADIAALVAYKIATVAYAEQKRLDRKAELTREQREACVKFVAMMLDVGEKLRPISGQSVEAAVKDVEELISSKRQLQKAFAELALLASEEVIVEAAEIKEYVVEYFAALNEAMKPLQSQGNVHVSEAAKVLNDVISERRPDLAARQARLITAIRAEQFDMPDVGLSPSSTSY